MIRFYSFFLAAIQLGWSGDGGGLLHVVQRRHRCQHVVALAIFANRKQQSPLGGCRKIKE